MMRTMNDAQARELLGDAGVGRLGCIVKGEPYVVPINYIFETGAIYSHSLPGRKIRALRVHPCACLQVDKIEDELHWQSVIAFGNFEEIEDDAERAQIMRKLLTRFPLLTAVESSVVRNAATPEIVIFRLRVNRVTGVAED